MIVDRIMIALDEQIRTNIKRSRWLYGVCYDFFYWLHAVNFIVIVMTLVLSLSLNYIVIVIFVYWFNPELTRKWNFFFFSCTFEAEGYLYFWAPVLLPIRKVIDFRWTWLLHCRKAEMKSQKPNMSKTVILSFLKSFYMKQKVGIESNDLEKSTSELQRNRIRGHHTGANDNLPHHYGVFIQPGRVVGAIGFLIVVVFFWAALQQSQGFKRFV